MDTVGKFLVDAGFNQGWKHLSRRFHQQHRRRRRHLALRTPFAPATNLVSAPMGPSARVDLTVRHAVGE